MKKREEKERILRYIISTSSHLMTTLLLITPCKNPQNHSSLFFFPSYPHHFIIESFQFFFENISKSQPSLTIPIATTLVFTWVITAAF